MMGLIDSPYHACQEVRWANSTSLEFQRGLQNTFVWYKAVLNFPGTINYDCQNSLLY